MQNMKPVEIKSAYTYYTEEFTNNYKKSSHFDESKFERLPTIMEKVWKYVWENMAEDTKKKYLDMSLLDEERYRQEVENYETKEKEEETLNNQFESKLNLAENNSINHSSNNEDE